MSDRPEPAPDADGVSVAPDADGVSEIEVHRLIEATVQEQGLDYSRHDNPSGGLPGIVVAIPAERRFVTNTIFSVTAHGVRAEAFLCRKPEENFAGVYRFMLRRNRKLYGLAYTLDNFGDIYLIGRMSLHSVTPEELDRLFGQVVDVVDRDFNALLELGFRTSIQKEWEWRVKRGESLQNLQAFAHLIDDD